MRGLPIISITAAVFALAVAGCGPDRVGEELLTYLNESLPAASGHEAIAVEAYASVAGDNYESDARMYAALSDTVIPEYRRFKEALEAMGPKTREVRNLHEQYVQVARLQFAGFILLQEALEKQDRTILVQANDKLDQGRSLFRRMEIKLEELCKKHGITRE